MEGASDNPAAPAAPQRAPAAVPPVPAVEAAGVAKQLAAGPAPEDEHWQSSEKAG
jgi:hypothetical protein